MDHKEAAGILVQVVPVDDGQEIGWGSSVTEDLEARLSDVRKAIVAGAAALTGALEELPSTPHWQLAETSARFGITLKAEAGVVLTAASAAATFQVTLRYVSIGHSADAR